MSAKKILRDFLNSGKATCKGYACDLVDAHTGTRRLQELANEMNLYFFTYKSCNGGLCRVFFKNKTRPKPCKLDDNTWVLHICQTSPYTPLQRNKNWYSQKYKTRKEALASIKRV